MKSGVYIIRNDVNKKQYIGSAINLKHRWRCHLCKLRKGTHPNKKLQYSWNKHGEENFTFEVILYISADCMLEVEQKLIENTASAKLYNIRTNATSNLGFRHSEASKKKMSDARKGKNNHTFGKPRDPEIIRKMNEARLKKPAYNKGKKMSEEQKLKISQARIGFKKGPMNMETKNKISQSRIGILPWNKGVKFSRLK